LDSGSDLSSSSNSDSDSYREETEEEKKERKEIFLYDFLKNHRKALLDPSLRSSYTRG
jgi:hypothetical protein